MLVFVGLLETEVNATGKRHVNHSFDTELGTHTDSWETERTIF